MDTPDVPRLYLEGHNKRLGQAISLELVDAPPVRYYADLARARRLVEKFNRLSERKHAGSRNAA